MFSTSFLMCLTPSFVNRQDHPPNHTKSHKKELVLLGVIWWIVSNFQNYDRTYLSALLLLLKSVPRGINFL